MIALALLCRNAKTLTRLTTPKWEVNGGCLQQSVPSVWKTGKWVMNYDRAMSLLGENLILVESKDSLLFIHFNILED